MFSPPPTHYPLPLFIMSPPSPLPLLSLSSHSHRCLNSRLPHSPFPFPTPLCVCVCGVALPSLPPVSLPFPSHSSIYPFSSSFLLCIPPFLVPRLLRFLLLAIPSPFPLYLFLSLYLPFPPFQHVRSILYLFYSFLSLFLVSRLLRFSSSKFLPPLLIFIPLPFFFSSSVFTFLTSPFLFFQIPSPSITISLPFFPSLPLHSPSSTSSLSSSFPSSVTATKSNVGVSKAMS